MEEKIKEIVSAFTKIPAGEIGPSTLVDRQTVKSSILLHRMYARLAEEGLVVENYSAVRTFGDLIGNRDQKGMNGAAVHAPAEAVTVVGGVYADNTGSIGIDIEEMSSLPRVHDFRKDEFYTMNFTSSEIAYCVLQPDPYASFAGLFSAKEAIIKADGRLRSRSFNSIGITHGPEGEPLYPGFHLSISHAGGVAVAVAIPVRSEQTTLPPGQPVRQSRGAVGISLLALAIAILAIILGFIR
ncbi:MAG TPA: 4'-phosphopantetheinyl transferase superfamily protein [Puia sp.]